MFRLPIIALSLSLSAWGAIARGGTCSGTTSCTPSTSAAYELQIAFAYRAGSTTAPSTPAGWTSIATRTGTTSSARLLCRLSISATPVASGTFTNATNVGIVGYTGTGVRILGTCATAAIAIGGNTANSGNSTTPSYSTVTMTNGDSTSWVLGMMGDATSGNVCTPSGMTNVAGGTTGDVSFSDTNAAVASWSATTCTVSSATWITWTLEIITPPANPPTISQLVNSWGGLGTDAGQTPIGNKFQFPLVDPTLSGNTVIGFTWYTYNAARTLTITNDKGDTATKDVTCNRTSGNLLSLTVFHFQNITAGATKLIFTFDTTIGDFGAAYSEWSGIATSGTVVDGTPSCSTSNTMSGGVLTDPTGTTTTATNDLIVNFSVDDGFGAITGGVDATDIIFATGYTGLFGSLVYPQASQAKIQATTATVTPSVRYSPSTDGDTFSIATIAFKTSSAGTARQTGKIIRISQLNIPSSTTATDFIFPCDTGNFIEITFDNNTGTSGSHINSIVDTGLNTWASDIPGGTNYGQFWHASSAVCNGQLAFHLAGTSTVAQNRAILYELSGAATSSVIDGTGATATTNTAAATTLAAAVTSTGQTAWTLTAAGGITNGSYLMASTEVVLVTAGGGTTSITVTRAQFNTTALASITNGSSVYLTLTSPAPTITTAGANEVIFCAMNQGTGPNWDMVNAVYDMGVYPGMSDTNPIGNGDGLGHAYAPTAASYTIGYQLSNTSQATNGFASALAVKLAATATASPPSLSLLGVGK